ncbi:MULTISPECIES: UDP-N-acetyl-D-mannosamine dehydrogenase [unclassified Pseudoalteromonas]|uniref:UDP-N-acetyl-D-mannosamine dehydrogenase n=1 Tax=Pseudoalteromonas sp. SD03 TaxID=3231719 RepID=A0AB39ARV6_9GAMM|nr:MULTISPECIES: UDP-N-acetyl-D-mannosamine dehydrogenase [unclassified Pseudoalteromonas]MDN3396816.1 UDP-N-acetyl-D-mannosamine dehydrogenase [Pseudoalteromonas sp. APC 3215]MDN3406985.1 UDP-N-acetyl-D-mannosamine dehydrogenase [Pseudoalteromonas sp. APC 3218]MDN3472801.1 UDP-N-acetyl-D-mannosamine dehydrogenase [Pseudoalteromonas sp. APC 4026]SFT95547.1 UDP-N-acetyl-D-mannosaminuronic acid dehydrogenase [Pseudoalteromonas sp. DSM 26666]|tara:strand:- start:2900 stop:4174 length:1275 start_codon:yes stop_codon:yes gene_type:complete
MSFNTISVVGLGYIGLPTAAMFASRKKIVIGVDVNQHAVDTINRGEIHIVEPDLDMIVHAAVTEGYLKAVTKPEPADAFLIAVPTPFKNNDSAIPEPDLSYIKEASEAIAPVLKKGDLVILESTSPVGATEQMADWLAAARPDLTFPSAESSYTDANIDVNLAHCPERVLPGHVVRELVENDRVIGGMTSKCSELAVELYKTFVKGECVITNARTAEMAKLTENSCRDVQIAFANELSIICDKLNIDVWELISLANRHPRINILQPGPGVGGHCIAVDPWFIVSKTPEQAKIIHTARKVNDAKPQWVINKVKLAIADFLQENPNKTAKDVTIACYGLAFKPDIDDLRESPALNITKQVVNIHSGNVIAVEPNIKSLPNNMTAIELCTLEYAIENADIHLLLVDHIQFREKKVSSNFLIDTKGIW